MWDAKFMFDASKFSLYGLVYTCKESKKDWISRTIDLENIDYYKHPQTLEELLHVDDDSHPVFNFHRSFSIEAINNETKALDRKAHMFWEIPAIDKRVCEFMDSISVSGEARRNLVMSADTKDVRTFFSIKKQESEKDIKWELSFIDCLFMMYRLKKNRKSKNGIPGI